MKAANSRLAWIAATASVLLIALYVQYEQLTTTAALHDHSTIRLIARLDAELKRDVLLLRAGLLRHYDSVNAAVAQMYERIADLDRVAGAELHGDLTALTAAVATEETHIEQFKSDLAIQRNSLMYLTLLADRQHVRSADGEAALKDRLQRLESNLMRHAVNPQHPGLEIAQALLRELSTRTWPPALRAEVNELVVHGSGVLDRAARIDETVRALMSSELNDRVQQLEHAYSERGRTAAEQARWTGIALLAGVLLLAAYLAWHVLRFRAAARELARNRDYLHSVFEASPDAILTVDGQQRIVSFNAAAEDLFGHTADAIVGQALDMLIPESMRESHRDYVRAFAADPAQNRRMGAGRTVRGRRADGSEVPLEVGLSKVHVGAETLFIASARDITERIRSEAALHASEIRFRTAFEQAAVGIAHVAPDGRWLRVNQKLCDIVGYTREELLSKTFQDITHPDDLDADLAFVRRMLTGEIATYTMEKRYFRKNRAIVWINLTVSLTRTDGGAPDYFIAVIEDISARKRVEEQLRVLNAELEQRVAKRTADLQTANQELEAFAYSVSHDLRSPLRAIEGFSQALIEDFKTQIEDRAHDYLARIRAATQRMGLLIDELLQFSRTTRGELVYIDVDLAALAVRVAARLQQRDPDREIKIRIAESMHTKGDPRLLEIVLDNLLDNAWKYTSKTPGARIEFAALHDKNPPVFYVRDNGAGFDMRYTGNLFGVFQRLHTEKDFPGIGIGLATVARIVHRHGGRVWAEAEPNRGATFFFTLS